MWFNPTVGDRRGTRAIGRNRTVAGAVTVVVIGALAAAAVVTTSVRDGDDGDDGERATTGAGSPPHFVDVTASSGVDHVYDGGFEYFVGGGVAAFDCDGDRRPDLFLAGGSERAALYRNTSAGGGAITFEPVVDPAVAILTVTGAYPLDIDSDGVTDLAVLRNGGRTLLRGTGDCHFEPADDRFGLLPSSAWTTAFSATWEDGNSLPTLAFGSYLAADHEHCGTSQLVRPDGDRYTDPVALDPGSCSLSMLFSDWSHSGRHDLRVANDRHYSPDGSEQLWRIEPGRPPELYGEDDGWRPLRIWGMGIASADVTGDGYPEVFLTSQGDNKLQTLETDAEEPTYRDIALRAGVTAQRPFSGDDVLPSTAWHPEFADVDNDGLLDLLVTKGNVEAQTDHAMRDPSNLLFGQPDGTFREATEAAGLLDYTSARGAAVADLDLDGLLDLVIVHRREPATIWHNVGAGSADRARSDGHWLDVRLEQPAPNVDAVGAWLDVEVIEPTSTRTVTREVTVGGGHVSGQLGWLHTGLGEADRARVRVRWPDGEISVWYDVDVDQFVVVRRGASTVEFWQPDPS